MLEFRLCKLIYLVRRCRCGESVLFNIHLAGFGIADFGVCLRVCCTIPERKKNKAHAFKKERKEISKFQI